MINKSVAFLMIFTICLSLYPNIIRANSSDDLQLISQSAILIDEKSGQVIYEKNSQEPLAPASITKIATAIYAIEKGNLNDIVTVSEEARYVDGTRVYLEPGEQVPLKKLVQGLLINSGNDAGVAIAEHLSGTLEQFVIDFNDYLKQTIGVKKTHFSNPHGLFHPEHVTTAADMAKITQYAMKNDVFREIFNTKELPWKGESWDTTIINHHLMVRDSSYEGITGGKNGFVNESGFTLVTTAEQENISLIAVVLNTMYDHQTYEDTTKLFDYGFQQFETEMIATKQFEDENNKQYTVNEDVMFTKKIGEVTNQKVLPSGKLVITGEDGRTIMTKPLTLIETEEASKKLKSEQVTAENQKETEDHLRFIVPISLVIAFLLAGVFFTQTRRL
ncbi:D-alanyl-D-alanine carboxypeptidase family protein [Metabacillus malikii]|uniref:D-alanyl-D-alanine carboxypeptidase n=1 Tax=Metabacillus malikii TaxID=1504265 RepID=A0ABT9ZBL3_9BACI|nr:D-alanyl-D-alanine carboxypeptidase family protein [Metabacillus malikii]MDQ0229661.1 D-alanyl-D-alanine carboxypeptidase [Metabacillus malikii]